MSMPVYHCTNCHFTFKREGKVDSCPDCGKPMKFVAKLSWEMLDFMEGNCYVEVCPECQGKGLHLKKLPLLKVDVGKVCKTCGGSGYLPQ